MCRNSVLSDPYTQTQFLAQTWVAKTSVTQKNKTGSLMFKCKIEPQMYSLSSNRIYPPLLRDKKNYPNTERYKTVPFYVNGLDQILSETP